MPIGPRYKVVKLIIVGLPDDVARAVAETISNVQYDHTPVRIFRQDEEELINQLQRPITPPRARRGV